MNFKELINDTKIKIENRFKDYYKNKEKSPFLKEALDELYKEILCNSFSYKKRKCL